MMITAVPSVSRMTVMIVSMSQNHIYNDRSETLIDANQERPASVEDTTQSAKEVANDDPHKTEKVTKLGRENMEPEPGTE
jgi:hypothetical protein